MSLSLGSAIVITLNLILAAYFFYTLVAIFKGGAPIPSRFSTVKSIMRLADIKPGDVVYDLGSGDGRILFAAHKLGARCLGFEINPFLYWLTRLRIYMQRADKVQVKRENYWNVSLGETNVVTVYLVPHLMERLKNKVKSEAQPGTRIICAVYPFLDWEPVEQDGLAYLYIV